MAEDGLMRGEIEAGSRATKIKRDRIAAEIEEFSTLGRQMGKFECCGTNVIRYTSPYALDNDTMKYYFYDWGVSEVHEGKAANGDYLIIGVVR